MCNRSTLAIKLAADFNHNVTKEILVRRIIRLLQPYEAERLLHPYHPSALNRHCEMLATLGVEPLSAAEAEYLVQEAYPAGLQTLEAVALKKIFLSASCLQMLATSITEKCPDYFYDKFVKLAARQMDVKIKNSFGKAHRSWRELYRARQRKLPGFVLLAESRKLIRHVMDYIDSITPDENCEQYDSEAR